jgi:hypothetical protein
LNQLRVSQWDLYQIQKQKIHDSLSHQIAYLSKVGSSVAHSSSVYGLEKDYELCLQELDVVSNKVNTLLQSTQKTAANGHFQWCDCFLYFRDHSLDTVSK